jgi:hypothetical protein
MSIHRTILAAVIAFTAITQPRYAAAQEPITLSSVTAMTCTFPIMWLGNWNKAGDAEGAAQKSDLVLKYLQIDTSDGTAEVAGFTGNFYITVRVVPNVALHLLHMDAAGPVYITTVFNKQSHPGKFKAAHARHEYTDVSLPGFTSRPEQYIGECELTK